MMPSVIDAGVTVQWATNPRSVDQAIAYAQAEVNSGRSIWYRRCLAFVGSCYGLPYTGTAYAVDMWSQVPASVRHPSSSGIPRGALLVYSTSSRAGHIALYESPSAVYSNDILVNGKISKVSFNSFINGPWRLHYLGWIPPYFPKNSASKLVGTMDVNGTADAAANAASSASSASSSQLASFLSKLTDKGTWINILLIIAGVALTLIALYRLSGTDILGKVL